MRKSEPSIIVIRRDLENKVWIRDHYNIEGNPESTYSGYVSVSTGLGSGEDASFVETIMADMFPNASVIISPPESQE